MEISAKLIKRRISFLEETIAEIEADRKTTMEHLEALNTRGNQAIGQKAECEFWLQVLSADGVMEAGE